MSVTAYDKNDRLKVSIVFTNEAGTATDPSAVLFKIRKPDGTSTTYTYGAGVEIVKNSTGSYTVELDLSQSGDWLYRWESTGVVQTASEEQIYVKMSGI